MCLPYSSLSSYWPRGRSPRRPREGRLTGTAGADRAEARPVTVTAVVADTARGTAEDMVPATGAAATGGGHGGGGHGGGQPPVKTPTATGSGGAAATVDVLATDAAIDMLRKGGNAVDATVAAAGVLGVTEPFSAGIGGGGFMVIRTRHGKVTTIDGRETAPAAMNERSFFDPGATAALSFADARWSGLSAGVPGTVATWEYALERYGTKSLRKTLDAGIDVARRGFPVDQTFFDQTAPNVDYFDDIPSTAAIYLDPDGTPKDVGSTLRNPDMAKAYEMIARYGARGFYRGPIAQAIDAAASNPPIGPTANHTWRPNPITEDDLARYRAIERAPTRINYKGLDVWGMGPPSSGGSSVGEALNILEGFQPLGKDRTQALHRYLEASRLAFADRGSYLADADFIKVPLQCLLSKQFAAGRRALITDTAMTHPAAASTACGPAGQPVDDHEGPLDDAPHRGRRRGHGGVLHVHDRVHGRQRHRRPGLGLPAQQRADGLRLRLRSRPPTACRAASARAARWRRRSSRATASRCCRSARRAVR